MAFLSALSNPTGYHILSYGTLLGSTLFQSFIAGIIAFRVLPRPQFSTLQKHTFPVFFTLQSITPALMAVSYPSGWRTLFLDTPTRTSADSYALWLINTMLITGLVNWLYVGPQTTKIMGLRKHQETRDGKKSYDAGPHSVEMQKLNKQFGILHGVSSLVNLVGFGAMVWYGFLLGERFVFTP